MSSKEEKIQEFCTITGASKQAAEQLLSVCNDSLEMAINMHMEGFDVGSVGDDLGLQPQTSDSTIDAARTNKDDEAMIESDDEDEKGPDFGQAFYTGGGQQVLGPSKKKTGADFVQDMLKKAKESGAEAVDPSTRATTSSGTPSAFVGSGFKLGSSETAPSEMVAGASKPKAPKQFIIKMWQNGFSINEDGELRSYKDPANRSFLASVMAGRIPNELVQEAENGEVHVDIEDHKEEEYQKAKGSSKIKAFTGTGHTLGGITPAVNTGVLSSPVENSANLEQLAQDGLKLDDTKPVATVQIRLHDGKTLKLKLNHSHTVGHLRQFVTTARPDLATRAFNLRTSFPSKELEDNDINIEDAGLIGAAVLLRLK